MPRIKTTARRALRGLTEPDVVYLMLRNWGKMVKSGRLGPVIGSVFETLLTPGRNPYLEKLRERSDDGLVVSDVLDFRMYLDVDDPGLSRTLLQFGVREAESTRTFRDELWKLREDVDGDLVVLDVGANIGYYALLEATALPDRGTVHAIEPVPGNVDVLRKNVALNDVSDRVSVHQLAIGDRDGETRLHTAEQSNWHSVHRISDHTGSIDVEMRTLETFLSERDEGPDSINVVRTDLEGYEVELFSGMERILAADTPLLVFVELHPSLRSAAELNRVLDRLAAHDFRIVSTTLDVYGGRFDHGWYEKPVGFDTFEQIKHHHETSDAAVLLIARKN